MAMELSNVVILYPPQLEHMAKELQNTLGVQALICTTNVAAVPADASPDGSTAGIFFDAFPCASGELPNIRVHGALAGKDVVLLMSQDEELLAPSSWSQLSLLLFLQSFVVPHPIAEHAKEKFKDSVPTGAFDMSSVRSLRVVLPWMRQCRSERTVRWARQADDTEPWTNTMPHGEWLDVPAAQTFAMLLSADPMPPPGGVRAPRAPPPPPKWLLTLDIHDDLRPLDDPLACVEGALLGSGKWANPRVAYNLLDGTGTYFASVTHSFLVRTFRPACAACLASTFVVFPDPGAYVRFSGMFANALQLPTDRVLYIEKSRVGLEVVQSAALFYQSTSGAKTARASLPDGAYVLVADDIYGSGSTFWAPATTVRAHFEGTGTVVGFITHFNAQYNPATVAAFVARLYGDAAPCDYSFFYTSDSVPNATRWLTEEVATRVAAGQPRLVEIVPCAPVVAEWLQGTFRASPWPRAAHQAAAKYLPLALAAAAGALATAALVWVGGARRSSA